MGTRMNVLVLLLLLTAHCLLLTFRPAKGTVSPFYPVHGLKPALESVIGQEAAAQVRFPAQQQLQGLHCLEAAHDPGHRAQNARLVCRRPAAAGGVSGTRQR